MSGCFAAMTGVTRRRSAGLWKAPVWRPWPSAASARFPAANASGRGFRQHLRRRPRSAARRANDLSRYRPPDRGARSGQHLKPRARPLPWSWRSTTSTRPCRSATASRCWKRAAWCSMASLPIWPQAADRAGVPGGRAVRADFSRRPPHFDVHSAAPSVRPHARHYGLTSRKTIFVCV